MKKIDLFWTIGLSFSLAIFIFVIVPVQTYLGSPGIFDFPIGRLLAEGMALAFMLGLLLTGLCTALLKWIGRRTLALWMSMLVCLYLETGILSIGLPPMNGAPAMANVIRSAVDFVVLGGVIVLAVLFHRSVVNQLKWIFLATAVMIVSAVFDARCNMVVAVDSPLSDGLYPRYDVLQNVEYSKNRNVLVYILDMTPSSIAAKVMERNPDLQKLFPGFVAFRKNKGMHEQTSRGLPGLMTGVYDDGIGSEYQYIDSVFGWDSFLVAYATNNIPVYYSGGMHDNGYTNRHKETHRVPGVSTVSRSGSIFMRHTPTIPNVRMIDSLLYRIVPYQFKFKILNNALAIAAKFKTPLAYEENELPVYDVLSAAKTNLEPMSLCVVHTKGLHWPITFDRNGRELENSPTLKGGKTTEDVTLYREQMREAGVYVFSLLGKHFEQLRAKGVYDKATIVVLADHGCGIMKEGKNEGSEDAVLWIKVPHAAHSFAFSDAPTTTCKVHDFVIAAKDRDVLEADAVKMLSQVERIYRAGWHGQILSGITGRIHYRDWVYDAAGALIRIEEH